MRVKARSCCKIIWQGQRFMIQGVSRTAKNVETGLLSGCSAPKNKTQEQVNIKYSNNHLNNKSNKLFLFDADWPKFD